MTQQALRDDLRADLAEIRESGLYKEEHELTRTLAQPPEPLPPQPVWSA